MNSTISPEIAQTVTELSTAIRHLQASRYTSAAATTIYIYDIFLTFAQEKELVWTKPTFTWPCLLYFINRYVCLGFFLITTYELAGYRPPLSDQMCKNIFGVIGMILAHLSWTGILTLRVCALWSHKKHIFYSIWILWVGVMAVIVVMTVLSYLGLRPAMTYNGLVHVCASTTVSPVMFAAPIVPASYELVLTILTTIRAYQYAPGIKALEGTSLITLLFRDGLVYFLVGLVISVANSVVLYLLPNTLLYLMLYLYWGLMATCVSRLVLNLRALFQEKEDETVESGAEDVVGGYWKSRRAHFIMGRGEFAMTVAGKEGISMDPTSYRTEAMSVPTVLEQGVSPGLDNTAGSREMRDYEARLKELGVEQRSSLAVTLPEDLIQD